MMSGVEIILYKIIIDKYIQIYRYKSITNSIPYIKISIYNSGYWIDKLCIDFLDEFYKLIEKDNTNNTNIEKDNTNNTNIDIYSKIHFN